MQRLSTLDLQFKHTSKAPAKKPQPKGNFVDCWSYLNMNEYLSPEGIATCKKVETFMTKINPTMYYYTENAVFPHHLVKEIADLGIVGLDTPKKYGGQGLSTLDACACMYELARKDASIATFYVLHHSLGLYTIEKILQDGPLKKQIFDECIPIKKVLAWGLTEPLNGSDASGLQTTAVKVPGGYKLTGQKRWVGNATFSDYICIWARNADEGNKIQCFLTRQGQPGLHTSKIQRKMALRAVQNADIKLDDVFVPDHERMELAKDFASGTKEVLAHSRIFVAWIACGIAAGATEAAMKYCQERIQFKKPVAQFQLIQAKLVRCVSITSSLITLCTQITRMYEQMKGTSEPMTIGRIAMMKAESTAQCREVCKLARECMGGNGINLENQAMKALCDIEAIHSYEGSWEVNTLVAGREMTGLAAFK